MTKQSRITTLTLALIACGPNSPLGDATDSVTSGSNTNSGQVNDSSTNPTSTATTDLTSTTHSSDEGCELCFQDLPSTSCDPFIQDCPQDQKCTVYLADEPVNLYASKCVMVIGNKQPGEPCTRMDEESIDDCIKGAVCLYIDGKGHGLCALQCSGSADAPICLNGGVCITSDGGDLATCTPPLCNPLIQDCSDGEVCVPFPGYDEFVCIPDSSGDEGKTNDPCESETCDGGLVCVNKGFASSACDPMFAACCQPICKFPDEACPNADQSCIQWYAPTDFPPDDPRLEIGYCGIPF